ncbi:chemotaxis protein CheW [Piscinibacter sp.]|uniref:chemotaxis protein CheW n=1 Tax=Piscinibacter sp. TaxID=1903157 RepID=UPI002BF63D7E|nr:chemotaxis protein CheW [Albitalea sp.]HUG26322.1 chemotaxis protein CheW [Albitalea sp.]
MRQIGDRATELRRDFDRSFAEPPRARRPPSIDLLAIRLGGDPHALRLSAISGVFASKKLTPLPGASPDLLGIAGFRGSVVPVYDLRMLLGYPASDRPRWLVVAAAQPVALAFEGLDGYLRLPLDRIARPEQPHASRAHVHELARVADPRTPAQAPRPLVDLDSIVAAIRLRVRDNLPLQQRERKE